MAALPCTERTPSGASPREPHDDVTMSSPHTPPIARTWPAKRRAGREQRCYVCDMQHGKRCDGAIAGARLVPPLKYPFNFMLVFVVVFRLSRFNQALFQTYQKCKIYSLVRPMCIFTGACALCPTSRLTPRGGCSSYKCTHSPLCTPHIADRRGCVRGRCAHP